MTVSVPSPPWRRVFDSPAIPIALLAAFAALLVLTITRFSLWFDESFSLLLVGSSDYAEIVRRTAVDVHPPLWYLVLKLWVQVFGTSAVAAHAESALFMFAAVGIWYHFVRTRFSRPLALLTLALIVGNPMVLHYAVEARMYAFSVLLVALSCVLITGTRRWRWFAYWPCAVAMLYVHYFLVLLVAAQFLYLLLRRTEQGVSVLWIVLYGASILAAFGPWLPVAMHQTTMIVTGHFWVGPVAPSSIPAYVMHTFLHRTDAEFRNRRVFWGLIYLTCWAASLIRAGRARNGPYALLWCMVGVPWLCLFALSCKPLVPVFHPRYVIFSLPALITLLAAGALGFVGRWRPIAIAVLLAGGVSGILMIRWRGPTDIRGYWSMNEIAKEISQPIDGELPWVASKWLFGFFDARATLDRHQRVTMVRDTKPEYVSPDVAYYGQPDLYVMSWSEIHARHVWVIDDVNAPPVEVPPAWKLVRTQNRGYARTRLFSTDTP